MLHTSRNFVLNAKKFYIACVKVLRSKLLMNYDALTFTAPCSGRKDNSSSGSYRGPIYSGSVKNAVRAQHWRWCVYRRRIVLKVRARNVYRAGSMARFAYWGSRWVLEHPVMILVRFE